MNFTSLEYLIFFPLVTLVYFLLPGRPLRGRKDFIPASGLDEKSKIGTGSLSIRNIWLLLASYGFYMRYRPEYALILLFVTAAAFFAARIGAVRGHGLAAPILICLAPLLFFKYTNFCIAQVNIFARRMGHEIGTLDIIVPVGISFFTFSALGYVLDVRKGKIEPEKNFFKFALFIAFYPCLLSGPINRANVLLPQFDEEHRFSAERVKSGFLRMLWGYAMKLLAADRIAVYVGAVYAEHEKYGGFYIILAMILYLIELYLDFASYSDMAIGSALVMGFRIPENFRRPFLSSTVSEYWRRWHVSLTSWLRDYIYIPLGGSRLGKWRKYLNIMIVFLVSGFWHGSSWNFVFWGALNGAYQVVEDLLKPLRDRLVNLLGMDRDSISHRIGKAALVFFFTAITFIFFRAESLMSAVGIIKSCFVYNPWVLFDKSLYSLGLSEEDFRIIFLTLCAVLFTEILNEKGISIRETVGRQELWFRWIFYIAAVLIVLIFGRYGTGYNSADFIYFRF